MKLLSVLAFAALVWGSHGGPMDDFRLSQLEEDADSTTELKVGTPEYRLPGEVIPSHYEIKITPNLEDGTFEGEVKIKAKVSADTNVITMHQKELTILKVSINEDIVLNEDQIVSDTEKQFLKLTMETPLAKDAEITITITYTGDLKDKKAGFYKAVYQSDGKDV